MSPFWFVDVLVSPFWLYSVRIQCVEMIDVLLLCIHSTKANFILLDFSVIYSTITHTKKQIMITCSKTNKNDSWYSTCVLCTGKSEYFRAELRQKTKFASL